MTTTERHSLDIEAILERLPHRYPFLLIDRVLDIVPAKSILALKNVSANEAFFSGHFPGHPVMPGVLVLEALAQAGGLLAAESARSEGLSVLYLVGVDGVRFRRVVRPGDQLMLYADLVQRKRTLWKFQARAEVDGNIVAEAEILMADGPRN